MTNNLNSSNVFTREQTNGTMFWSQILPKVNGGFALWYTDGDGIDIFEFSKIVSTNVYSLNKNNSTKQILILGEDEDKNLTAHKFGYLDAKDANEFLLWLQQRIIF